MNTIIICNLLNSIITLNIKFNLNIKTENAGITINRPSLPYPPRGLFLLSHPDFVLYIARNPRDVGHLAKNMRKSHHLVKTEVTDAYM